MAVIPTASARSVTLIPGEWWIANRILIRLVSAMAWKISAQSSMISGLAAPNATDSAVGAERCSLSAPAPATRCLEGAVIFPV